MIRNSFNKDWKVRSFSGFFNVAQGEEPQAITLPHDAMIARERVADKVNGNKKSYFPEGSYEYIKHFFIPEEYREKRITFEFEGVYMNAMVYINGDFAGQHPYGYTNFYIKADRYLKYGEENEIKVVARSSDDSRWYTGTGIYRNTKMIITNPVHIALDGVKVTTPDISEKRANVIVTTNVENEGTHPQTTEVRTEIIDAKGEVVASDCVPLTAFLDEKTILRQRLYVKQPKLWNVDTPYLYTCRTYLMAGDEILDEETTSFGIRSLSLNAKEGLCINGEMVKLRGACVHHDNGVIGAVTIDRAEERRIEILKEAGFNAVRSSHNPISKAMLDACDRLGMLVMDEAFDIWTQSKSDFDYALYFPEWWERDIEAMIDKDFNHPSVIIYSIGNEITDTGTANGAAWSRKLAEKVRCMDSTRYIVNSINGVASAFDQLQSVISQKVSGDINTFMTKMGDLMKEIQGLDDVSKATAESFASVDIAGYNYADNRYEIDKELFPNRVVCGTETFPKDIANNWRLVKENNHVLGDFTWTGWDYLGEVGIGKIEYAETNNKDEMYGFYPYLTAYCGDIDIIGNRRPASYYREIVFGLRSEPYIAVERPMHYNKELLRTPWSWTDTIASWSWAGYENKPVKVEVYSDAEEIELYVNDKLIERKAVGEDDAFTATFDTTYTPGRIEAIAYTNGEETGRHTLMSAGKTVNVKAETDRSEIVANDRDLAFVMISLEDENGILNPLADRKVSVKVEGAGVLQGFGTGNPKTEESYIDGVQTTFDGYALAVIRPTSSGTIQVIVEAENCAPQTVTIQAKSESDNRTDE